jgi:hypothetical protein
MYAIFRASSFTIYAPYFGYGCDSPRVPLLWITRALFPSSPPAPSRLCGSSESDGEGGANCIPPSVSEEYRPTRVASPQKQKKHRVASQSRDVFPRSFCFLQIRVLFSPSLALAAPSRNLQREDGAGLIDKRSDLQHPVVGWDYVQMNQR